MIVEYTFLKKLNFIRTKNITLFLFAIIKSYFIKKYLILIFHNEFVKNR